MTIGEVLDTIKAHEKIKSNEIKEKAIMDFKFANSIRQGIASLLDKEAGKDFNLLSLYGEFFENEKAAIEEEKKKAQIEINKQRMIEFMNRHNAKRRGGNQ